MATSDPPSSPPPSSPEQDIEQDTEDRNAILARRAIFITSALAGLSMAVSCDPTPPQVCLSIAPVESAPRPCLSVAIEPPDAGTMIEPDSGADAGSPPGTDGGSAPDAGRRDAGAPPDAGPTPQPCLRIAPPPNACLKIARPPNPKDR